MSASVTQATFPPRLYAFAIVITISPVRASMYGSVMTAESDAAASRYHWRSVIL
jgi:hypothetical protein